MFFRGSSLQTEVPAADWCFFGLDLSLSKWSNGLQSRLMNRALVNVCPMQKICNIYSMGKAAYTSKELFISVVYMCGSNLHMHKTTGTDLETLPLSVIYPQLWFFPVYTQNQNLSQFFSLSLLSSFSLFSYLTHTLVLAWLTETPFYCFPADRQINTLQDEKPPSVSGTLCCGLPLRLLWYTSFPSSSLCYHSAAIIYL